MARPALRLLGTLALALITTVALPSSTTNAATAPDSGAIEIVINAAADVAPSLTATLSLDGTDVTADRCAPGTGSALDCTGLPDGTYDVGVSGVPAGLLSQVQCVDIVATPGTRPVIDVAGGFFEWFCTVYVGTPAIFLTVGGTGGAVPSGLGIELPDAATLDCVPDEFNGVEATRCRGLAPGTYAPEPTGPWAERSRDILCEAVVGSSGGPDLGPTAEISDSSWLWWCDLTPPLPNVSVNVFGDESAADVSSAIPVITGPDGDVSDSCGPGNFVSPGQVEYVCVLDPGTYSIEWTNLPDGDFEATCTEFAVTGTEGVVGCDLRYQAATATTTTTPAATSTTLAARLPATGSAERDLGSAALALVGAGALLLLLARRRPSTS